MNTLNKPWTWRFSALAGVMYGPIPVGAIVVVMILIALLFIAFTNA